MASSAPAEAWAFELFAPDASLGASVRLTTFAGEPKAWFWAAVVGDRRPLVAVRDHDVPAPRGRDLDVRSEGLWASITCETPGQHWSVGMEAFALAYDDPAEAVTTERGDVTPLGFDLEWEADGDGWVVHGDVLIGEERLAVDTLGTYRRIQSLSGAWTGGRLDDGTWFDVAEVAAVVTRDGLLAGGVAGSGELRLQLEPAHHAPAPDVARALCRVRAADGRTGAGWAEAPK